MLTQLELDKLATEVVEMFKNVNTIEASAIKGFFRGLSEGMVTVGQSWPVKIILESKIDFSEKNAVLIEKMFASGIFGDGQFLTDRHSSQSRRF